MSVATGTAIAIGAGIGAAGSIGGAAISANAAGNAAGTQANAADYAANLQHQDAQAALQFQEQQYNQNQANFAPWLHTGQGALTSLADLLGITPSPSTTSSTPAPVAAPGPGFTATGNQPINMGNLLGVTARTDGGTPIARSELMRGGQPGQSWSRTGPTNPLLPAKPRPPVSTSAPDANFGSLLKGWDTPFVAPTNITEANDPGYAFRLQQGQQALENSAASRGGLLSTGTAKNLEQFGQDYASNEYGNVYNRALGQYQQNYNIFQQNQANQFNRLASLAGVGQTAAGQLSSSGQAAAGNIGSILLNSGQQIGQNINNAAAARASGYVGGANAFGGALSNSANNIGQLLLLQNLLGGGGVAGGIPPIVPAGDAAIANENPYGLPS